MWEPVGIIWAPKRLNLLRVDPSMNQWHHQQIQHQSFNSRFPIELGTTMLPTAPSLSVFNTVDGSDDEDREVMKPTEPTNSGDFTFGKRNIDLIDEDDETFTMEDQLSRPHSPPMYLATGLGINSDSSYLFDWNPSDFDDSGDADSYYRKMVDEHPSHPLILMNYAKLQQAKGDFNGAEEYYLRATLSDPENADVLTQYAKFVWEHYRDQERASNYFELARQASPQDSNVLGAYAKFLWEIEDDEDGSRSEQEHIQDGLHRPDSTIAEEDHNVEENHRKMVEENPHDPLVLKNFALFLSGCKGDLVGAEEYYLRAIQLQASREDAEIMSQYAKLLWELHQDRDKALYYFERAVKATPDDSHVLAAYARFLWEAEVE